MTSGTGIALRCDKKLHGMLLDGAEVEVKCDSRFCGARPGVTVLHRFSVKTGELLSTDRFLNPPTPERKDSMR